MHKVNNIFNFRNLLKKIYITFFIHMYNITLHINDYELNSGKKCFMSLKI